MLAIFGLLGYTNRQEDVLVNSHSRDLDELGDALLLQLVSMTSVG